jgi:uncharacterized membrane protein YbhN (UPF0104 family)
VVSTAVTVVVLLVVFVGIFPKVADYSEAWSSIQQMPTAYVVALGVATVLNVAVYVWPLQAALPGLGYGPGFVVRQTSFAISNAVPAGGAVGLGVQYGMLDSYGFGAGAAASAIAIVSVFNVFATLVMPVIGVLALLAGGVVEGTYLLMAAVGVAAIVVGVVAFAVVLRSERGARTVGRWADRLVNPLTRRLPPRLIRWLFGGVPGRLGRAAAGPRRPRRPPDPVGCGHARRGLWAADQGQRLPSRAGPGGPQTHLKVTQIRGRVTMS